MIMHTICYKPSLSLSFNHHSYLFNGTFERNPLFISSPLYSKCACSCCCRCCYYDANVSVSKRVIFYGTAFRVSSFNYIDRSYCYEKISAFKESRKKGSEGFVGKRKKQFLSSNGSGDNVGDVEVMLRLITGDLGLECIDVGSREKISKKHTCGDKAGKIRSLMKSENLDLGKDGLSGELEGQNESKVECDGYVGQKFSNEYKDDLGKDHKVSIEEVVGSGGTPQECVKERGNLVEKKDNVSVGASQDWRKKSEKKLNEEFSHRSNVYVNIEGGCRQHSHEIDKISDESGSRMKYKRFSEMSDKGKSVIESTCSTEKKLKLISEVSKPQEIDIRGTSSLSESRIKSFKEKSTDGKDQIIDRTEVKHIKEEEKSQHILEISENASSSEAISNDEGFAKVKKMSTEDNNLGSGMVLVEEGSGPKGGGSRPSSQGSGLKGPSDEMWLVTDASTSTQDPSETDAPDHTSDLSENGEPLSENGEPVKTSGRSLWTIIGDVVRLPWKSPHSESYTPNSRGAKVSSYMSASRENWFSSHDPDDSNDENMKKRITKGLESPLGDGPSKSSSLPISKESSFPLPAIKKTSKKGELKRRKLELKDEALKDNFDEWEEAYTLEAKQRKNDENFMREALLEAKKAADVLEVPVGAVLVKDGIIIARGHNLVEELRDSTAHAEMICIRKASTNLRAWRLTDTTLYVTLEPCPMCAGAMLQARIDTVVWGAPNKLLGADGSWVRLFCDGDGGNGSTSTHKPPAPQHPFHPNMVVRRGVLEAECAEVMQKFFRLRRKKKPEPEPEPEPKAPPSSVIVSHHHHRNQSNFFSMLQHVFKIIFCL